MSAKQIGIPTGVLSRSIRLPLSPEKFPPPSRAPILSIALGFLSRLIAMTIVMVSMAIPTVTAMYATDAFADSDVLTTVRSQVVPSHTDSTFTE